MASLSNSSSKSIVFSYHRNHQEFALKIYFYLKNANLPVWIDIQDGIEKNIYRSENGLVENISVLVCLMTPMYQSSKQCQYEVQLIKSEGIPIIAIHLLPNWKPSGWLNKITSDLLTIDLRGINQNNFQDKMNKLREKIVWLLENNRNSQMISHSPVKELLVDQSIFFDDSNMFSWIENVNQNCSKKQAIKSRILPEKCCLNLSNLLICNNEYILIYGNNSFHLFDRNLKVIRSNNDIKINENDLKDLSWCSYLNHFLILTKKQIYLMNPLTNKLSLIENLILKEQREEFLSCSFSEEKYFLIKCQYNTNSFYFEEYHLPKFRFLKKYLINDFIGTYLFIQNGLFNQNHIQQIISIRYYQEKIAIIMQISFQWFIYIFHLSDQQPVFLTKISLEEKSRMTILNPINQWIIFKDYLSNTFIQISPNFQNKQSDQLQDYTTGFIHFNGKLRSVALFGISNLVLLIDNALVLYKL